MTEQVQVTPRIVLSFQDYIPPFDGEKAIRRILQMVPPKFLSGLHTIVLTNIAALPQKVRERKRMGRRRVVWKHNLGYYIRSWKGQAAGITLLIDNLEKRLGRKWLLFGITRDAVLAEVFFRELGHHVRRICASEFETGENVAEKWGNKMKRQYLRSRYGYLLWVAAPFALAIGLMDDIPKLYRRLRT
jgi:hypothetical protein